MSVGKFLQNAGLAALAAAIAVTAMPAAAQERGGRNREARAAAERIPVERAARPDNAQQARTQIAQRGGGERREQRAERREQRADRVDRRTEQRAVRVERQGDRAAQQAARQGNVRQARQIDRRSEQAARQIERRGDQRANRIERRGDVRADRVERRGDQRADRIQDRNRSYADSNRNRTYRGNDTRYRDGDRRWSGNDRYDGRRWDRRWRDNNRYDWQRYRTTNRVVFRLGTYYSPYRNYSYRRFSIGGFLDSLFYGQNYWISDPWQYRLPPAPYGTQWVRYYDDVLLVDVYTGEVVDVIHNFFW